MIGHARKSLLALLLMAGCSGVAVSGAPATLNISQALAEGQDVRVYLEVRDEAGGPVDDVIPEQLHATVGPHTAEIKGLDPFAPADAGVTYLFLVDLSRSLSPAAFERIRRALVEWIGALGPRDRAGLIGFGDTVRTLVAPTADKAALTSALAGLGPTDGHTALHEALYRAIALGRQESADLPERRAIVTLTDGLDDAPGGMSADEVYAALEEGPVPIYAIGFSSVRDAAKRAAGLNALGGFARRSGGAYLDGGREDPSAAFSAMRSRIGEVYVAQLHCADCSTDGNRYRVQIGLRSDGLVLGAGTDLRLLPTPSTPPEPTPTDDSEAPPAPSEPAGDATTDATKSDTDSAKDTATEATPAIPTWVYGAGAAGVLALVALIGLVARSRRNKRATAPEPPAAPENDPEPEHDPEGDGESSPGAVQDAPVMPASEAANAPPPSGPPITATLPAAPPVRPSLTVHLTFMTGPRRGERMALSLSPRAQLGRIQGADLPLSQDPEVSSRHAEIEVLENGRVVLRDLGSTNGTRLNGIAIQATHPLQSGDVIGVGQTELRIAL